MTSFSVAQNSPVRMLINLELSNDLHTSGITVGDLRKYVRILDDLNIPDDHEVEGDCDLYVMVRSPTTELIGCGECLPQHSNYDVLITTHTCVSDLP